MTHDWSHDVKKYVPNADEGAVKGIIKHCGIALHSKDASFVACNDKSERDRVRDGFLKKKLGPTRLLQTTRRIALHPLDHRMLAVEGCF